jgi:hypothetical protein
LDWIELDWQALRHLMLLDDESISNALHIIIANTSLLATWQHSGQCEEAKKLMVVELEGQFSRLTEAVYYQSRSLLMGFNKILSKGRLTQKLEQCLGKKVWSLVESSANNHDGGEDEDEGFANVAEIVSAEAVQQRTLLHFNMWRLRRPPTLDHLTAVFSSDPENEVSP